MPLIYIGLGSNIGDCRKNLSTAADMLSATEGIIILKKSMVIKTEPVEFEDQPDFLNQIILIESEKSPVEIFNISQKIETDMGRIKSVPKGPRIIDLDILLYGSLVLKNDILQIPHPGIKKRWFVLKQLIELDEGLTCPETGTSYREVYHAVRKKHQ